MDKKYCIKGFVNTRNIIDHFKVLVYKLFIKKANN